MSSKRTVKKLAKTITNGNPKDKALAVKESEETKGVELIQGLSEDERNALYVLDRDDEGYAFTDLEKKFVANWIEFKNLVVVSSMMGITQKESASLLSNGHIRKEIDRISQARVKFRFARRILTLDECEAYLTTSITDEGVGIADQLNSKDKLSAMKLLLEVKQLKADSLVNPTIVSNLPDEKDLDRLSVEDVKECIARVETRKSEIEGSIAVRQTISSQLDNISDSEKKDIESMSEEELTKILDNIDNK